MVTIVVHQQRRSGGHRQLAHAGKAPSHTLETGESGRAYLVGDENLSWKDYLELWFREAGNPRELEVRDDDHPLFPNAIMFAGPGATVAYEVDPEDHRTLGSYDRQQLLPTVRELLSAYNPGVRS